VLFVHFRPSRHLDDRSKSVITVAAAAVGTASALVLGLLISTAGTAFMQRGGEVVSMATDVVRLDQALRCYGRAASVEPQELGATRAPSSSFSTLNDAGLSITGPRHELAGNK